MSDRPKPPFQRSDLPADVGGALRDAREAAGRARRDVAAGAGIATRTLARIERGAQSPTWPTLERLCEELEISSFAIACRWASQELDLPENLESAPGLGLRALRLHRRPGGVPDWGSRGSIGSARSSRHWRRLATRAGVSLAGRSPCRPPTPGG